ncbi:MAG: response regulator transcription factor [Ruminococcus sp.]|nr:response regulator transcription factor [Ruminococcus sp.]
MKTILVVDDDIYIGNMLEEILSKEGYCVLRAYSGTEALMVLSKSRPDLMLLDLMLPGLSGEKILPAAEGVPVIIVSAKADVTDKVSLLMNGAADYVTKPFNVSELLARIAVQLRQCDARNASEISACGLTLCPDTLTVTVSDQEVHLTRTECAVLKLLMQNEGRPVGRTTILDRISLDTPDCTERSLKQHISNIRKKLSAADNTDHIEAVYGIGFKLK